MATKKVRVKATALRVQSLTEPGRHWVDNGLFLQIDKRNLSKSWVFRYRDRSNGKLKSKGIGGNPALSLAEARKKADGYRMMLHSGTDPIQTKRAKRDELRLVLRELKRKMQAVAEKNGLKNVRFAEHPELDQD